MRFKGSTGRWMLAGSCVSVAAIASPAMAQVASDSCQAGNVTTVVVGNPFFSVNANNLNCTPSLPGGAPGCSQGDTDDVWFRFVAPRAGVYGVNTIGSFDSNGIDTALAVYSACPESGAATQLDCNDDIFFDGIDLFSDSAVFVTLTQGQAAFVRISGFGNDTGTFVLNIVPPAINDDCIGAIDIVVDQAVVGSNAGATTTFANPDPATLCSSDAGAVGVRDVFYRFTPPASGAYKVSACVSDFDTVISVLNSCPATGGITSVNVLACNDDAGATAACNGGLQSEIDSVNLTAGVPVFIRVAGYNWDTSDGPAFGFGTIGFTITSLGGTGPVNVTCCRGTTCTLVPTANCVVPASPPIGVQIPLISTSCNAGGSATTPCCFADFDKSGGRTIDDIFIFLTAWFTNSPFTKIGGDGIATPTIDDIFTFLTVWFAGGC